MSSYSSANDHHYLPPLCPHLAAYRSNAHGLTKPFLSLHRCLRARPPGGRAEIRREPDEIPHCGPCGGAPAGATRLYACLACAAVSCPAHAPAHAAVDTGHEIAVDVNRAELFCCVCRDQVYDRDFDAAVVLAHTSSSALTTLPLPPENLRKRRRGDYRPLVPDPHERAVITRGSRLLLARNGGADPSTSSSSSSSAPWGLRGLNNLGNTCFMNSVLQALLHAPPLRNYFLGDRHNRFVCQQRSKKKWAASGGGGGGGGRGNLTAGVLRVCLACDLDAMYSAVFSGDRSPYSPAKFLYSWWQHASNLASYEQQDAHEFFISILDGIHEKLEGHKKKSHNQGSEDCCIAHRVFSGILRSDVTCTCCGFTSTTYDPCVDISLDLDSSQRFKKVAPSKRNGEMESSLSSLNSLTLMGCLDRFTRPEKLGSDQKFFCQHCQVKQESLKQMSIRKLPLVICFHVKRFEHLSIRKMSRKIDSYLQFPFSLDMSPYLSSSILRSRFGNRIFAFDADDSDASSELASKFELFAVITHSGRLEAGHYITYLRLNNQWYKCDDAWITHVNENFVRTSQAYMLFYVQKALCYKASENVVAS